MAQGVNVNRHLSPEGQNILRMLDINEKINLLQQPEKIIGNIVNQILYTEDENNSLMKTVIEPSKYPLLQIMFILKLLRKQKLSFSVFKLYIKKFNEKSKYIKIYESIVRSNNTFVKESLKDIGLEVSDTKTRKAFCEDLFETNRKKYNPYDCILLILSIEATKDTSVYFRFTHTAVSLMFPFKVIKNMIKNIITNYIMLLRVDNEYCKADKNLSNAIQKYGKKYNFMVGNHSTLFTGFIPILPINTNV